MINTVLIGYGYWGPNIARNLNKSDQLNLYGVCDVDPAALARAKTLYGESIRYYTDYREIFRDESVQACAVALRSSVNQPVARDVLKAGRHLFMEKPMALTVENALLQKKLADERNLIVHVDHILVYHPVIRRIKKLIDEGELGDVIYFESNRANLGPHIKNDMNAMWDLAVHDVAVMDYLFPRGEPTEVHCTGVAKFGSYEELTYMTVKYPDFVAMFKSSWISPVKERSMLVCGTKKMAMFDDLKESAEKLRIYDKGVDIESAAFAEYGKYEAKIRTGDLYVPYLEPEDSLLNSLNHFAACVRTGRQSVTGPEEALRVLSIITKADKFLAPKGEKQC